MRQALHCGRWMVFGAVCGFGAGLALSAPADCTALGAVLGAGIGLLSLGHNRPQF